MNGHFCYGRVAILVSSSRRTKGDASPAGVLALSERDQGFQQLRTWLCPPRFGLASAYSTSAIPALGGLASAIRPVRPTHRIILGYAGGRCVVPRFLK
jgi:hypothetical protein